MGELIILAVAIGVLAIAAYVEQRTRRQRDADTIDRGQWPSERGLHG